MAKSLHEAYQLLEKTIIHGYSHRQKWLRDIVDWLKVEYAAESVLSKAETIALAKKLLCRGLQGNWTRAEVEEFLKK